MDRLLEKLKAQIESGRTAGREIFNGGVLFWSIAQSRSREPYEQSK